MKKGISPVIATIIILLITVAIAGSAWSYISGYWGGLVSKNIEITDAICTAGAVTIYVHNIGRDVVNIENGKDLTIIRTIISGTAAGAMTLTYVPADKKVAPGEVGRITDSNCGSGTICRYRLIVAGRVFEAQAKC